MTRAFRRRCPLVTLLVCILAALSAVVFLWTHKRSHGEINDSYVVKFIKNLNLIFGENSDGLGKTRLKNPAYILDTPGCRIPNLDPYDSSVISLVSTTQPETCAGEPLFFLTQPNGSLCLNVTVLEKYYNLNPSNISCIYQGIRRKYEKPGNVRENDYVIGKEKKLKFGKPLNEDHVVVNCRLPSKNLTQYIPIPRIIKNVEKRKSSRKHIIPHLNILMVAIDSVSKLNFLRHFKKTQLFLKEKLAPFEMNGYTKVGDNTFPNLITLLSGHFAEEIWNETLAKTMLFDDVDLVWKIFAEKGYRTFFTEDMPLYGTFNYGKRGFHDQPTDYYFRPLALAIQQSELKKKNKKGCLNSETETDIMYNYVTDFVRTMGPRPYFAFVMSSSLTHNYLNSAGYADGPTARLLENLWNIGALNDSAFFFFSDHGVRFGGIRNTYIGKFEERLPFMYVHFPAWFLRMYPSYSKNLQLSQERLITLFDIHATLLHVLEHHKQLYQNKSLTPYGTSLLSDISPFRTCEKAGIMAPWCVCQLIHPESLNETPVIKSSEAVVDFINEKLKPFSRYCSVLELDRIIEANSGQISDLVLRFVKHENVVVNRYVVYDQRIEKYLDYTVVILTKPGYSYYEGTVRHDTKGNAYHVLHVSRLKSKNFATNCINDPTAKQFCVCDS